MGHTMLSRICWTMSTSRGCLFSAILSCIGTLFSAQTSGKLGTVLANQTQTLCEGTEIAIAADELGALIRDLLCKSANTMSTANCQVPASQGLPAMPLDYPREKAVPVSGSYLEICFTSCFGEVLRISLEDSCTWWPGRAAHPAGACCAVVRLAGQHPGA